MKTVIGDGRDLATFVENNQEKILSCLETEGAILLRGFTPAGASLDHVARLLGLEPRTTYVPGIAPRKAAAPGNPAVFTSTEAPPHLPILPHTEMTYWPPRRPTRPCCTTPGRPRRSWTRRSSTSWRRSILKHLFRYSIIVLNQLYSF